MHQRFTCRRCSLWCLPALRAGNRYHRPKQVNVLPACRHTSHLNQMHQVTTCCVGPLVAGHAAVRCWPRLCPAVHAWTQISCYPVLVIGCKSVKSSGWKVLKSVIPFIRSCIACVSYSFTHLDWRTYKWFWYRSLKFFRRGVGELCYNIMAANSRTSTLAFNISVPISIQSIRQHWQPPTLNETYLKIVKLIFLDLKVLLCYLIKSLRSLFRIFFISMRKKKLHWKHTRDYVFARVWELRHLEKYLYVLRLVTKFWKSRRWVPGIIFCMLLYFIATSVLHSWNA